MNSETNRLRANIFDWLIIVTKKIIHCNLSYLLATNIIDKLISEDYYGVEHIHLISIVSMQIAQNYHEVSNLLVSDIEVNIGHYSFKSHEINRAELFILKKLKLTLPTNYFIDFIYALLRLLSTKRYFKKSSKQLEKVSSFKFERQNTINAPNIKKTPLFQIYKKMSLPIMTKKEKIHNSKSNLQLSL